MRCIFLIKIIKRIVFALGFLYTLNIILQPINIMIPINIYSITMFYFLGVPSVLYFIFIRFF